MGLERIHVLLFPIFLMLCVLWTFDGNMHAQGSQKKELDQEFYNDYLDSLPNRRAIRKKTLETNLLRVFKKLILRRDPFGGPGFNKTLTSTAMRYKQVNLDSVFIRGLFHELKYLRPTPYMYIVGAGPYRTFVSFKADPRAFLVGEFQTRTLKRKKRINTASEKTSP